MCNKLLKHGDFNGCLELTSDSVRSISDGACGLTMDSDVVSRWIRITYARI
jgi:hypothetical protein